jgi:hypothetical protein
VRIPRRIEVELIRGDSSQEPLLGILVAIDTQVDGRYYFGTLVGLTDTSGVAVVEGEALERDFRHNQALFPMDYRVPLSDCDPQVAIRIQGGEEFLEAQAAARDNAFMNADDRARWAQARNTSLSSTSLVIALTDQSQDTVRVRLPIRPRATG